MEEVKKGREKLCLSPALRRFSLMKEKSAEEGKNQVPKSSPVYQEMDSHLIAFCIKEP